VFCVRWYYTESVDGKPLEMGHVANQTTRSTHPECMRITVQSILVMTIN